MGGLYYAEYHLFCSLSGSGFFVVNFGAITKINCIVSNIY